MSDNLVKRLRDVAEATGPNEARQIALDAADSIEELEAKLAQAVEALTEIKDVARASQGPAAQFYGMLANKALTKLGETNVQ